MRFKEHGISARVAARAMVKAGLSLSLALTATLPVAGQTADIEFVKRQIKQLEDAGIDATDMRKSLKVMEDDAARAASTQQGRPAAPAAAQPAGQVLVGQWAHPTRGVWTFGSDGVGKLVRQSVNGIPGTYTITLNWSVEGTNTLVYTPIRNTLVGSPDSDRDEPITNPKTYRAPFEIAAGKLILGGAEYNRR